MSKNWKITIPTARVYVIPWEGNNNVKIEQYRYQNADLELPKKTNAHLWIINLSTFKHLPFLEILTADENLKLNRIITPLERESRIKSRIVLRLILSEYLNIAASEIVFLYGKNGKPTLKKMLNKVSFNISHSANNLAVLIGSHRSVGVDLESGLRPNKVGFQLAKRFFSQQEFNLLQEFKSKEQSNLFNQIWTLKEAVLKATGTGMFLIGEAPDFSSVIQQSTHLNLQFYKISDFTGFMFYTHEFWLSTAAKD